MCQFEVWALRLTMQYLLAHCACAFLGTRALSHPPAPLRASCVSWGVYSSRIHLRNAVRTWLRLVVAYGVSACAVPLARGARYQPDENNNQFFLPPVNSILSRSKWIVFFFGQILKSVIYRQSFTKNNISESLIIIISICFFCDKSLQYTFCLKATIHIMDYVSI